MGDLAKIHGNKLVFKRELVNNETIYCSSLEGINHDARLNDIVVENRISGAGVRIIGDKPLSKMVFWASPTTVCPESYIPENNKIESRGEVMTKARNTI